VKAQSIFKKPAFLRENSLEVRGGSEGGGNHTKLILQGNSFTADKPAAFEHLSSGNGSHSFSETMSLLAFSFVWLVGKTHNLSPIRAIYGLKQEYIILRNFCQQSCKVRYKSHGATESSFAKAWVEIKTNSCYISLKDRFGSVKTIFRGKEGRYEIR